MAKIVKPPKPQHKSCDKCHAVIEFLPEEIEVKSYYYMGDRSGHQQVKCPRPNCPGYATWNH